MVIYKSYRIIEGSPTWVIENSEDGIINKNPTKEQLKNAIMDSVENRKLVKKICCVCGRDWTSGVWYRKINRDNTFDIRDRLCSRCHQNEENDKYRKPLANFRTGNLSRYTAHGLGYIGARIVAITNGLDDCNMVTDNFCFYVDLSEHLEYGYCEVKTASFLLNWGRWTTFSEIKPWNFDSIFLVCMDGNRPWENVCRIYIVPSEYVDVNSITIYLGRHKLSKWDRFKVDRVAYNDTYRAMKIKNCNILREDGM